MLQFLPFCRSAVLPFCHSAILPRCHDITVYSATSPHSLPCTRFVVHHQSTHNQPTNQPNQRTTSCAANEHRGRKKKEGSIDTTNTAGQPTHSSVSQSVTHHPHSLTHSLTHSSTHSRTLQTEKLANFHCHSHKRPHLGLAQYSKSRHYAKLCQVLNLLRAPWYRPASMPHEGNPHTLAPNLNKR